VQSDGTVKYRDGAAIQWVSGGPDPFPEASNKKFVHYQRAMIAFGHPNAPKTPPPLPQ